MEQEINEIADAYTQVQVINDEYSNERNKLNEQLNQNGILLNELNKRREEKVKKMTETSNRKDYFSAQFYATSHSILEITSVIKETKLMNRQKVNKIAFENEKKKFNDYFLVLLENMKKRVFEIDNVMKEFLEKAETRSSHISKESFQEKEKRFQQLNQNCLLDSFRLELITSKNPINLKMKMEEIEGFLNTYLPKKMSLEAIENLIEMSHQNLRKLNEKSRYQSFYAFLENLLDLIYQKKEDIKKNHQCNQMKFKQSPKKTNYADLQQKYNDYFKEVKNFQISQREFISVLNKCQKDAKSLIASLEEIDMTIKKLNINEALVNKVGLEISNNDDLKAFYIKEFQTFKESFDRIKKEKQALKQLSDTINKNVTNSHTSQLSQEKIQQTIQFSLIFSLCDDWLHFWKESVQIELQTISQSKSSDLPLLDEDELGIVEKMWVMLKYLGTADENGLKSSQIDETKQKIEDNQKIRDSLEKEIKLQLDLDFFRYKKSFFEMWKDGVLCKINEEHKKFIQKLSHEPEDILAIGKSLEKVKLLKNQLKERMAKDQLEVVRGAKKFKELDGDVEKIDNEMNSTYTQNEEINGKIVELQKEFDKKIAQINEAINLNEESKS